MLPVSSQQLLGLSPPLPLELVKALLLYLDAPGVFAVGETSRGGRWLLDEEEGAGGLWRVRGFGFRSGWEVSEEAGANGPLSRLRVVTCPVTRHRLRRSTHTPTNIHTNTDPYTVSPTYRIPHIESQGWMQRCLPPPSPIPGAPQPILALLLKEAGAAGAGATTLPDMATAVPTRQAFAAFYRLRSRAVRCVRACVRGAMVWRSFC